MRGTGDRVRLLWAVPLALLALLLLFYLLHTALVLALPHQVEYGEGPVLAWAQQIAAGSLPYKAIAGEPWSFSVYTPGYLGAAALTLRLAPALPWLGGRLLSLAAALGLALLFVPATRGAERRRLAALLAAGLWLVSPYLLRWSTFYRPDLFALFWSALGIVLVDRGTTDDKRHLLVVGALSFALAFWSKQSFFAAPLAALLFLAARRRDLLLWLLLPGAVGAIAGALLLWGAAGGEILQNLVVANANPFSWPAFLRFEGAFLRTVPVVLLLAALAGRRQAPLLVLYALFSLGVTLSVGKAGAWENYFLEPLWPLVALAGMTLARPAGRWGQLLLPAALLLQLLLYLPGYERRTPADELAWSRATLAEGRLLADWVTTRPPNGPLWSEQMGVLAERGRRVPLHSFVYTQLERQGVWEPTPLVDRLRAGEGAGLIQSWNAPVDPLRQERWSRRMLDAAERGFGLGTRVGPWALRPPLALPPSDLAAVVAPGILIQQWTVLSCIPAPCTPVPPPIGLTAAATLEVHLLWQALDPPAVALSTSVQLFDPDGIRVAQHDAPLRGGLGGRWPPGAMLRDEHPLTLPARLSPGAYSLLVAIYESDSGQPIGQVSFGGLTVGER